MKIEYQSLNLRADKLAIIEQANVIIERMQEQGYTLSLRQLYYQFVKADAFPDSWKDAETGSTNNERSYKRLGDAVSDGRLAGLIDWDAIEDRGRELTQRGEWEHPRDIVAACAASFRLDLWKDQPVRPEVWIEKDALSGVIDRTCRTEGVAYFACKGYGSISSMWAAGQRLLGHIRNGQVPLILHLGDHDPSGIDMSRDIRDRLSLFLRHHIYEEDIDIDVDPPFYFKRLALNIDQVRQYDPPPNPAKVTDSRAKSYILKHGRESWELDALEPAVINALITDTLAAYKNTKLLRGRLAEEQTYRDALALVSKKFTAVQEFVNNKA